MKKKKFDLSSLMRSKITWAVIAEILILLVCLIVRPEFFKMDSLLFFTRSHRPFRLQ